MLDEDDNENICLIERKITTMFIKLVCGHTFNYEPIFNDYKTKITCQYKETQN